MGEELYRNLYQLSPGSDRVRLTVRLCRDGTREWLGANGTVALVFYETERWWARESDRHPRVAFLTEIEALDALLSDLLKEIRQETRGF